ncbi:MAG: hypothetical protein AAGA17_03360 [Actinomycetota bacterium]
MAELEPSLQDLLTARVAAFDAEGPLGVGTTTFIDTIAEGSLVAGDREAIEQRAVTGALS